MDLGRGRATYKHFLGKCKAYGSVLVISRCRYIWHDIRTNKCDMQFAPLMGVNHHGELTLIGCGLISIKDVHTLNLAILVLALMYAQASSKCHN